MKLSLLPLLALLGTGLSTPLEQRDIAAIKSVLTNINTQVNNLDSAITAKPLDAPTIVQKSDKLAQTIRDGTANVKGQEQLSSVDALGLVSPTQDLADDTETTVQDLIGIKGKVQELGKGCTSLKSLQELNSAAKGLSGAIVDKVPESVNSIAGNLSDKISGAIQKGVDAYQGACQAPKKDAGGVGGAKAGGGACKAQ